MIYRAAFGADLSVRQNRNTSRRQICFYGCKCRRKQYVMQLKNNIKSGTCAITKSYKSYKSCRRLQASHFSISCVVRRNVTIMSKLGKEIRRELSGSHLLQHKNVNCFSVHFRWMTQIWFGFTLYMFSLDTQGELRVSVITREVNKSILFFQI